MTESSAVSNHFSEFPKRQNSCLPSLLIGVIANLGIWASAWVYLNTAPPEYASKWSLTLPGGGFSTNIDLPNIGAASSQVGSAYGINRDPRENYKFIITSQPVLRAVADRLKTPLSEFDLPRVKIIDNSTLMRFEVRAGSPEAAQQQSFALYSAFQERLTELRLEEADIRRGKIQSTLVDSQQKLEEAQRRLSEYKSSSGLVSNTQIEQLSSSIEQLRRQKAEILAQQQDATARFKRLSSSLKVSTLQATDAFTLKVDSLFEQYRREYSAASVTLASLESRYGYNHPSVSQERKRKQAAKEGMQVRSQAVLGQPAAESTIAQLNLGGQDERSSREALFLDLVTTQAEQEGHQATAQELDKQITQLENQLKTLSKHDSTLDSLRRDLKIAETVFSSTLTGLDLGKSEISATYPQVQLLTEPSLPRSPISPSKKFTVLGAVLGSLLVSAGLTLYELRKSQYRQRKKFKSEQKAERIEAQAGLWLPSESHSKNNTISSEAS